MDWSLLTCGVRGHVSYAPEEPRLRARLHATSDSGESWRCLRCGAFVPGEPTSSGPAAEAFVVRRGKELRGAFILRFFAVERFARTLVFAVLAYGVWRFKYSKSSFEQAFDRELPVVRTLLRGFGYDVNHSKLIGLIQHAFTLNSRTLTWLAVGAAAYALVELIEGIGLWLLKRWGEYFAMVVTSVGIPYEIYDLTAKITPLRLAAFAINVALVVYLVLTKRLFGVRGGKKAYEARLRTASIIDSELALLAAAEAPEMTAARAADPAADAAVPAGGTGQPLPAVPPEPVPPEPVTPGRSGQGSPP